MRFFYADDYDYGRGLPLRQVHGFVLDKPSRIVDALVVDHGADRASFEAAPPIDEGALGAVHTPEVLAGLRSRRAIARAAELPPLALLPTFVVRRAVVAPQLAATAATMASDWLGGTTSSSSPWSTSSGDDNCSVWLMGERSW